MFSGDSSPAKRTARPPSTSGSENLVAGFDILDVLHCAVCHADVFVGQEASLPQPRCLPTETTCSSTHQNAEEARHRSFTLVTESLGRGFFIAVQGIPRCDAGSSGSCGSSLAQGRMAMRLTVPLGDRMMRTRGEPSS